THVDNSDNLSILNILNVFKLARIDIKNIGNASNDIVFDKNEYDFTINSPKWFRKNNDGIGYIIESSNMNLDFSLICVNDGEIKI
ncbi:hypothetical protein SB749_20060, partial [Brevibacterium sp. SIMBA_078]|uniref:hypothetical protein n=1 Tax=Brevibacterium sp. SIMBA_078 TaxID=3085816 RepID=UPI00397C7886